MVDGRVISEGGLARAVAIGHSDNSDLKPQAFDVPDKDALWHQAAQMG